MRQANVEFAGRAGRRESLADLAEAIEETLDDDSTLMGRGLRRFGKALHSLDRGLDELASERAALALSEAFSQIACLRKSVVGLEAYFQTLDLAGSDNVRGRRVGGLGTIARSLLRGFVKLCVGVVRLTDESLLSGPGYELSDRIRKRSAGMLLSQTR